MSRPVDALVRMMVGTEPTRLHEIDIENLVGSGVPTAAEIRKVREAYNQAVGTRPKDLLVIAAGPQNRNAVVRGWPDAIYLFKKGEDGADEALVQFFEQIEDKSIFTDFFVGSGDNKFSRVAEFASLSGIRTTVVIGKGSMSWKLNSYDSIQLYGGAENV